MKSNLYSLLILQLLLGCSFLFSCTNKEARKAAYEKPEIIKDAPSTFLSPEGSMKTFHLPEGYSVELVASEPMINEPVAMEWDANGRLYVAQMETYMQDIDGTDEDEAWSRILVLEDTNDDGKMDKSTVFIDSLVLPRIILPVDDGLIVSETYDVSLWLYKDTNGDGKADKKKLLHKVPKRDNRNLEHQAGSMLWNIDNWLYVTRNSFRFRYRNEALEIDTLKDAPFGQWGLTQDEIGRMFYSLAGGEVPSLGFQRHPFYGEFTMKDQLADGFKQPWPIVGTPDVQGGTKRLREDGTLNHFTGVCGQSIFLGDKLPAVGDLFIPEPVGRLIRRAKVNNIDGKIVLTNAYHESEFLASTDMNFRPVDSKVGPDGCLYVLDMYRGIIQEGNWVREGSFLRPVVARKGLDKNFGRGRLYRIVHEDFSPSKKIKLGDKSPKELVEYLLHPNAWYRMNAQKLLVIRRDESVIPRLKEVARDNEPLFGSMFSNKDYGIQRLHALWTLEGLDALDKDLVLELLEDDDYRVRCAALRNTEPFLKTNDSEAFERVTEMIEDPSKDVQIQVLLSLKGHKGEQAKSIIYEIMKNDRHNMVIAYTGEEGLIDTPEEEAVLEEKYKLLRSNDRKSIIRGYNIYKGLCTECHGDNGEGKGDLAPPLRESKRVLGRHEILSRILLHGLTGPLDGKAYTGVMIPMKNNDDQWIADVMSYIRKEFNDRGTVRAARVRNVRAEEEGREKNWTLNELEELFKDKE
ncbi:MAG: c-type cytochrome [Cyclobacteriaceae bacterium]